MYVNVPWVNTIYSLPAASTSARGGVKIGYTQTGKNYPVQLSSEKMYVNVPWVNTTLSGAANSPAIAVVSNKIGLNLYGQPGFLAFCYCDGNGSRGFNLGRGSSQADDRSNLILMHRGFNDHKNKCFRTQTGQYFLTLNRPISIYGIINVQSVSVAGQHGNFSGTGQVEQDHNNNNVGAAGQRTGAWKTPGQDNTGSDAKRTTHVQYAHLNAVNQSGNTPELYPDYMDQFYVDIRNHDGDAVDSQFTVLVIDNTEARDALKGSWDSHNFNPT